MSFRNRPVLDRRHRPRWREERRTQQVIVAAFALTIALALGIFGAAAWNDYYNDHLRQVALVGENAFNRDAMAVRATILSAELQHRARALQQGSDPADPLLQQRLDALATEAQNIEANAVQSLVTGATQRRLAGELGLGVTDAEITAEIEQRATTPEQVRLSIIAVDALPEDAAPGAERTEEDFARTLEEAEDILGILERGTDFAQLASVESDDPSAQQGGDIGFISADDPRYPELFDPARGAEPGAIIGPVRTATGYTIARVEERREASTDPSYLESFTDLGIEEDDFRAYISDERLDEKFRAYFEERVAVSPQEQRRVAQIFIAEREGSGLPESRVRHILIQPLEGAQDQSAATEEQWQAALERANELREVLLEPDADWDTLAAAVSADPGSAQQGGDLGWVPLASAEFVPEFTAAAARLDVGELSEPVRTEFGYHLIQVTDERTSAAEQVAQIAAELEEQPRRFADIARRSSEDETTAADGGEIGWVARYELDPQKERAIFALAGPNDVSDPVAVPGEGTYIFQLLESDEDREVEPARLQQIRRDGYERWLEERRESVGVWIDPEFGAPAAPGGLTTS